MISDVRDEDYTSPALKVELRKGTNRDRTQKEKDAEVFGVLWWIAFVVSCIMCACYCVGLYFTYFEDPTTFYKDVKNERIPGRHLGKAKKNVD